MTTALKRLFPQLTTRHDHGCLTLYLAAGPGWDQRYYPALLKDVERSLAERVDPGREARLQEEIQAVLGFVASDRPAGQPLALFSCAPDAVFEARRLPEDVDTRGEFGPRFQLGELERQLEAHPPGVAVVVEKDHAVLYSVVLEDVEELDEVDGRRISDTKKVGPSSSRHPVENDERLNIKDAVDRLMQSPARRELGLDAIYVAGPVEARSRFLDELPEPLRRQVAGEFEVQTQVPAGELAQHLREKT